MRCSVRPWEALDGADRVQTEVESGAVVIREDVVEDPIAVRKPDPRSYLDREHTWSKLNVALIQDGFGRFPASSRPGCVNPDDRLGDRIAACLHDA